MPLSKTTAIGLTCAAAIGITAAQIYPVGAQLTPDFPLGLDVTLANNFKLHIGF